MGREEMDKISGPSVTVFKGGGGSPTKWRMMHIIVALGIWLGGIHLNFALGLISLFYLSLPKALLVFAFLLMLVLIPVHDKSKFGRLLASRFCCLILEVMLHLKGLFGMLLFWLLSGNFGLREIGKSLEGSGGSVVHNSF